MLNNLNMKICTRIFFRDVKIGKKLVFLIDLR